MFGFRISDPFMRWNSVLLTIIMTILRAYVEFRREGENDPSKYVPQFVKEIIERIKQLQWAGTVLQSTIPTS
jgi:hypothetical protein